MEPRVVRSEQEPGELGSRPCEKFFQLSIHPDPSTQHVFFSSTATTPSDNTRKTTRDRQLRQHILPARFPGILDITRARSPAAIP